MKILALSLFVLLAAFAACDTYATETNTQIYNYPAAMGNYNQLTLENLQQAVTCSASNQGLIFYDTGSNAFKICGMSKGAATSVPYGETCFNRFANSPTVPTCPSPYAQAKNRGILITDTFQTSSTGCPAPGGPNPCIVNSVICCYGGSTIIPQ